MSSPRGRWRQGAPQRVRQQEIFRSRRNPDEVRVGASNKISRLQSALAVLGTSRGSTGVGVDRGHSEIHRTCKETSGAGRRARSVGTRVEGRDKELLEAKERLARGPTQQRRCNVCSISLHRRKLNFSSTVPQQCHRVPQRNDHGDEKISCVLAPRRSSSGFRIGRWTSKRRSREAMRQRWPGCPVWSSKQRRVCNHSWWRNLSHRQGVLLEWETR